MILHIEQIGAYAGIAALFAVVLLALLYFSQARDVRRLRDWAGRAPERAAQAIQPYTPETAEHSRPSRARLRVHVPGQARYVAVVVAGVLVFGAAITYGIVQLTSTSSGNRVSSKSKTQQKQKNKQHVSVQPGQITVAVLNGTGTPGLAASVGSSVKSAGFKVGNVTNASESGIIKTKALYEHGKKADAVLVAKRLKISRALVMPLDAANAALAGRAQVVVITGQDRTSQLPASKSHSLPSANQTPTQGGVVQGQGTGAPAQTGAAPAQPSNGQIQ